jgi:hypothetical protein
MKTVAAAAQAQTAQVLEYLGRPLRPWAPFVIGWKFVMRTRMISAKPRVAMAR